MGMAFPKPTPTRDRRDDKRQQERDWQQLRHAVLVRDEHRCRACKTRAAVDVHHITFRSAGRSDTMENTAALCRTCHRDVHGYRLTISGNANGRLRIERTR